jgi:hypothetical protein
MTCFSIAAAAHSGLFLINLSIGTNNMETRRKAISRAKNRPMNEFDFNRSTEQHMATRMLVRIVKKPRYLIIVSLTGAILF